MREYAGIGWNMLEYAGIGWNEYYKISTKFQLFSLVLTGICPWSDWISPKIFLTVQLDLPI